MPPSLSSPGDANCLAGAWLPVPWAGSSLMETALGLPGDTHPQLAALLRGSLALCCVHIKLGRAGSVAGPAGGHAATPSAVLRSFCSPLASIPWVRPHCLPTGSHCLFVNPVVKGLGNKIQFVSGGRSGWKGRIPLDSMILWVFSNRNDSIP